MTALTPFAQKMTDAAQELACRIDLGEFDDLDETEMTELRTLAEAMSQWAAMALALENRLSHAASRN